MIRAEFLIEKFEALILKFYLIAKRKLQVRLVLTSLVER